MVAKLKNSGRIQVWLLSAMCILAAVTLLLWWLHEHLDMSKCGEGRSNTDACIEVQATAMAIPFLIMPFLALCALFALIALVFFLIRWVIRKCGAASSRNR